jgi:hypothetical protein
MSLEDHSDYEYFLRMAYTEGWRDPVQVSNLEIEAYHAGMITERKRVLSIFKDVENEKPMRAMDVWQYINKIKKNPV